MAFKSVCILKYFKILKKGTLPFSHVSTKNKILSQASIDEGIDVG